MSTSDETTIQLPVDAAANKNLLRAVEVDLPTGTTLQQVIVLGDSGGNLVNVLPGGLAVADDAQRSLLEDIRDRLDLLIDLFERK
jgi:hypothetical protein